MSEKQTKRKRRAQRRSNPGNEQPSGTQGSLWEQSSSEQPANAPALHSPGFGTASESSRQLQGRQRGEAAFGPLAIALSAAVPLQVMEFYQQGGPGMIEIEEGRAFGRVLAERGDRLLYRGSRPGETADLFADLARALAAVCFVVPGGFPDLFGERYDAVEILGGWIGEEAARAYCQEITERYLADLPQVMATFTMAGSETPPETITCDVTLWFDLAGDEEILRLRAEDYRSALQGEGGVAARIVAWAAERHAPLAALCQRANTAGQGVTCRVDAGQANYYCSVHRRKLRTSAAERA